ncbi:hypothetical protein SAMN05661091_4125 [Paenibacillus uliginis N3/975]|uniref:Uncharacterized protein n=1 Tax=Paenibacillus uliginis N3/975 TaxID=1313296 RepID=A0A1X7HLP5_9BACL|nr:hypothetical protein SAMN05661091_4125 [Paenibacillus uliginis N3/975]
MKQTQKKILRDLIYLVLIIVLLTYGSILLSNSYTQARERFEFSPTNTTLILLLCFGGIGALLGSDNIILTKKTKYIIDKSRFLTLTLPSFIVSMSYIWSDLGLLNFNNSIYLFILEHDYILIVSSIVFGYSISSAFRKKV